MIIFFLPFTVPWTLIYLRRCTKKEHTRNEKSSIPFLSFLYLSKTTQKKLLLLYLILDIRRSLRLHSTAQNNTGITTLNVYEKFHYVTIFHYNLESNVCAMFTDFFLCVKNTTAIRVGIRNTQRKKERNTQRKKKKFLCRNEWKKEVKRKKNCYFLFLLFLWKAAYNKLISSTSLNLALLTVAIKKLLLKEQKWILAIWFRWRIKRKQKAPFVHKKESSEGDSFLFYFTHQKNGCGTWLFFPRLWSTKIFVS